MKILLVRHAEGAHHQSADFSNGSINKALSDLGREQAQKLAKRLSQYNINYIYSSDICRAVATAYVISDEMPEVTVMLTKDLRVRDAQESDADFEKRIKHFYEGLLNKYNGDTVLIVAHMDVLSAMFKLLNYQGQSSPAQSSLSEFNVNGQEVETVIVNDTSFLN